MLRNYIKIAIRNITNQKFYSFVNLTGLTVGIATSLLIILYITDELAYDTFHSDADRIFRVTLNGRLGEQEFETCYSSSPLGAAFVEEIPEIESGCRIALWKDINIEYEDDVYTEKQFLLADSGFFNFFTFDLVFGDPKSVLQGANRVVLTESTAIKIFGAETDANSVIGKTIYARTDKWPLTVTGLMKDPPRNSHFHFNMVVSMDSWDESQSPVWVSNNLMNYIKLDNNAEWHAVEEKFPAMVKKHVGPQVQQALGISLDEFFAQGGKYAYGLETLSAIHLYSKVDGQIEPGGNINTLYLLSIIVIALILVACINFMNLSTARYTRRAKEVGIRKTLGGSRKLVILQFLGESVFFSMTAMLVSIVVLSLSIPSFNNISGKILSINELFTFEYMALMVLLAVFIGVIAGSYPAFYLSSFKPLDVLSGRIRAGLKSSGIRRGLVVFQFCISIGLIICTLLIYKQLMHLQKQDLGFDKENVLVIRNTDALGSQKITFKNELKQISGIKEASYSNMVPPEVVWSSIFQPLGLDNGDRAFNYLLADAHHATVMDLEIVQGRYFSEDFPSDSNAMVINEAAAKLIGWENPIGGRIRTYFDEKGEDVREVIGVLKDYNFQSLKEEVTPLVIFLSPQENVMAVRLTPGDVAAKVAMIQDSWSSLASGAPFEFSFVDESFDAAFRLEERLGKIFLIFSGLAILVACLGLFGLATFTTEQRSKEIGIRKTLGSSSIAIVKLLSKEYVKLVLISFVIASPIAYYGMSRWLIGFAYQTNIGILIFIISGSVGLIIALLSVAYQSIKAASRNPVNSLKYE